MSQRIAKAIAHAGLCSRREAEQWIEAGRVAVNGEVISSPALTISNEDEVKVDGALLPAAQETRLFLFHKPPEVITSNKDPEGRQTVFELLPKDMPRVVTIGRLDYNTEGLLLLTTDGELARILELPAGGWERQYRVRVFGDVSQETLASLKNGITIEGVHYAPIEARLEEEATGKNHWVQFTLTEGKNREIRRVCEHFGWQVNRLIRTHYGPFELQDLAKGAIEEIPQKQLQKLVG